MAVSEPTIVDVKKVDAKKADAKKKGRPRLQDERTVYQALLNAAKECLDEKGYHRISTREIAARACTNAAMINYYFGGKGGLFVELIETMFEDLHARMGKLDKSALTRHPQPNQLFVRRLQEFYSHWYAVLRLFSSEVVVYNTTLREAFKQRMATVVYNDVLSFLEFMAGKGVYRSDIDLRSMALLLAGLVTVPYHFTPFLAASTQQPIRPLDAEQWQAALIGILDNLLLKT